MRLTRSPRASRRQPMEAAGRPFPNQETTPPVTKMYLADISATSLDELEVCAWCARLSIAGLGCGGNGLTFGENPGGNWLGFERRTEWGECGSLRFPYGFTTDSLRKTAFFFMEKMVFLAHLVM